MTFEIKVMSEEMNGRKYNASYIVDEYEFCKKGTLDAVKFHKVNKGGKTRYTWGRNPECLSDEQVHQVFQD